MTKFYSLVAAACVMMPFAMTMMSQASNIVA